MSYYMDDTAIGNALFDGETVPGDNTISTSRNTYLKRQATSEINRHRGSTTNATDSNNELEDIAIYLYKKGLDGFPVRLSKENPDEMDMILSIQTRFGASTAGQTNTVPIYNHDPQDSTEAYDKIGWHDDL